MDYLVFIFRSFLLKNVIDGPVAEGFRLLFRLLFTASTSDSGYEFLPRVPAFSNW